MEITITKDDFEKALPVGTNAHEEVYESVRPAIDDALRFSDIALLGDAGMEVMESKGGDTLLQDMYKQTVCLSAFLGVLRQLDLVLTPTGFGVVSNDNLTPASKMRVDALEAQLRTRYDKALALTLHLLRSEEWGSSPQARYFITHLYDEYTFYYLRRPGSSHEDWAKARGAIDEAAETLRWKMGDAQADALLDAYRRDAATGVVADAIDAARLFTEAWLRSGREALRQPAFRRLMRALDSDDNAALFQPYRQSAAYKANHHEPYRNTKDSAGYVFNG